MIFSEQTSLVSVPGQTYARLPEQSSTLSSNKKAQQVFWDCLRNCCAAIWNPCCANETRKTWWLTSTLLAGAGGICVGVGGEAEAVGWPLLFIGGVGLVLGAAAYVKECRDGY